MQQAAAPKQVAMDRNFEFTASYLATFVGETTLPRKVEVEDPNGTFNIIYDILTICGNPFPFWKPKISLLHGQETLASLSRTLKLNPTYKFPYEHEALGNRFHANYVNISPPVRAGSSPRLSCQEAWSIVEGNQHRALASYSMERFQRNPGVRPELPWWGSGTSWGLLWMILAIFGIWHLYRSINLYHIAPWLQHRPGGKSERMMQIKAIIKSKLEDLSPSLISSKIELEAHHFFDSFMGSTHKSVIWYFLMLAYSFQSLVCARKLDVYETTVASSLHGAQQLPNPRHRDAPSMNEWNLPRSSEIGELSFPRLKGLNPSPGTLTWQESLKTQSSSSSVTELEVDKHIVVDLSELDPRICVICQDGSTKHHQPE